jgi:hypothetical protein
MDAKYFIAVEKWTLAFAAVMIAFGLLVLNRRAAFGLSLGAGLMALNAWAIRRIGARAFKTFKKPGAAVLLLNLKMALLIAIVFVVIHYLPVNPIAFVVGISIFPVAIVAVALQHKLRAPEENETHG